MFQKNCFVQLNLTSIQIEDKHGYTMINQETSINPLIDKLLLFPYM